MSQAEEVKLAVEKEEAETPTGVERTRPGRTYVPRVDIYETESGIVLLADVPGADQADLEITLEKNVLTLEALVTPMAPEGYDLVYQEYGVGNFYRAFNISDEVDQDNITAHIHQGVLQLTLPRRPELGARKIAVTSA